MNKYGYWYYFTTPGFYHPLILLCLGLIYEVISRVFQLTEARAPDKSTYIELGFEDYQGAYDQ